MNNPPPSKKIHYWHLVFLGLYEESHGIVANHFWDPNLNETFSLSSLDINFWNQSLPLWTLAEQNGVTAGCFQYPGCGVKEQMPTYILADQYIPGEKKCLPTVFKTQKFFKFLVFRISAHIPATGTKYYLYTILYSRS